MPSSIENVEKMIRPRDIHNKFDFVLNVTMFLEDIWEGLMPDIGGHSDSNYLVDVSNSVENLDLVKRVLSQLSTQRHTHNRIHIDDLLCDVVRSIGYDAAYFGKTAYEIFIYYKGDDDQEEVEKIKVIELKRIESERYWNFLNWYLILTHSVHDVGKSNCVISQDSIWEVRIPRELGGTRRHNKNLSQLAKIHKIIPEFWMDDIKLNQNPSGFNQTEHFRMKQLLDYKLTKEWGWHCRKYGDDIMTEMFIIYRALTFKWAQAVFRNHIIKSINNLLFKLDINSKISVQGLPEPDEILRLRDDMIKGKISFNEALEKTNI